jgi:hypothetical protein
MNGIDIDLAQAQSLNTDRYITIKSKWYAFCSFSTDGSIPKTSHIRLWHRAARLPTARSHRRAQKEQDRIAPLIQCGVGGLDGQVEDKR